MLQKVPSKIPSYFFTALQKNYFQRASSRYVISTLFGMAICCRFAKEICKNQSCLIYSRNLKLSQIVDYVY